MFEVIISRVLLVAGINSKGKTRLFEDLTRENPNPRRKDDDVE
jgi:hypothetical protein